jgi:predicted ATP-grasp superfamily ATP-dependent carboligase
MPSITIDTAAWELFYDKFLLQLGEDTPVLAEVMRRVGEKGQDMMVERTINHMDKTGATITGYSTKLMGIANASNPEYFALAQGAGGRLSKSGRSVMFDGGYEQFKQGLGGGEPDLVVTGKLLGLKGNFRPFETTEYKQDSVTIAFTDAAMAERADRLIERNGEGRFDFWGIAETEKEVEELSNYAAETIETILEGALSDKSE